MPFHTLSRVEGTRLNPGMVGDPGLFSTIGKIASGIGSVLPGPIGLIARGAGRLLGATEPSRPRPPVPRVVRPTPPRRRRMPVTIRPTPPIVAPTRRVQPVVRPQPVATGPPMFGGAVRGFGGGGAGRAFGPAPMMAMNGACPSGFHLDKETGTTCVRNRRTNFANPRALNRAIRRVEGFGRLVQRSKKSVRKAANAIAPQPPRRTGPRVIQEAGRGSVQVR